MNARATDTLVFRRFGGSVQVEIPDFATLARVVDDIRDALWVATACPVEGLTCDPKLLTCLDADNNGRVRVEEFKAAVAFTAEHLADRRGCDEQSDTLVLARLSPVGALLGDAARLVAQVLGVPATDSITLKQVRDSEKSFREAAIHGDGIVAPDDIADARTKELAEHILACSEAATNRGGKPGVGVGLLAAFRDRLTAAVAHLDARAGVMAWGDESLARARATVALRPRIDEFFLQCRLVAAQPDALDRLRLTSDRIDALMGDAAALEKWLGALPIARPNARGELVWSELLRTPSFEALQALRRDVVVPALGEAPALAESQWHALVATADAILAWQAAVDAERIHTLGEDVLRGIGAEELDALGVLQQADLAYAERLDAVAKLERLLLYQRWLLELARNFIAMPDLYHPARLALFQRGTLVLAGREFTMCVFVPDRAAHIAIAELSSTCLMYVQLKTATDAAPWEVVVPVTAGTSRGIRVGKRGIFRDHEGKEHDAVVVHFLRQPVSILEAILDPFVRAGEFVGSKIESMGSSGQSRIDARIGQSWERAGSEAARAREAGQAPAAAAPATPAPAAPAAGGMGMGGIVLGGGVAVAALGSSVAFVVNQLRAISWLGLLQAAVILLLVLLTPLVILAWWKLRRRDLAIVLEGSGWALNDRLRLTRRLGRLLTRRPARPKHSRFDRADQVAQALALRGDAYDDEGGVTIGHVLVGLLVAAVLSAPFWAPHVLPAAAPSTDGSAAPAEGSAPPA